MKSAGRACVYSAFFLFRFSRRQTALTAPTQTQTPPAINTDVKSSICGASLCILSAKRLRQPLQRVRKL